MSKFWPRRPEPELACQPWPGPPELLPGGIRHDCGVLTGVLVEHTEPLPVVQSVLLQTPGQQWRANGVAVAEAAWVQAAVAQHVWANGGRSCW